MFLEDGGVHVSHAHQRGAPRRRVLGDGGGECVEAGAVLVARADVADGGGREGEVRADVLRHLGVGARGDVEDGRGRGQRQEPLSHQAWELVMQHLDNR